MSAASVAFTFGFSSALNAQHTQLQTHTQHTHTYTQASGNKTPSSQSTAVHNNAWHWNSQCLGTGNEPLIALLTVMNHGGSEYWCRSSLIPRPGGKQNELRIPRGEAKVVITDFDPTKEYTVSVIALSGNQRSKALQGDYTGRRHHLRPFGMVASFCWIEIWLLKTVAPVLSLFKGSDGFPMNGIPFFSTLFYSVICILLCSNLWDCNWLQLTWL